jgi:hypothetical protein
MVTAVLGSIEGVVGGECAPELAMVTAVLGSIEGVVGGVTLRLASALTDSMGGAGETAVDRSRVRTNVEPRNAVVATMETKTPFSVRRLDVLFAPATPIEGKAMASNNCSLVRALIAVERGLV